MDGFWTDIEKQCVQLCTAKSADEVIAILNQYSQPSAGDAFFAGGGGDTQVSDCLAEAGWAIIWMDAAYYWVMAAPDGSMITYIEGDVFKGDVVNKADKKA